MDSDGEMMSFYHLNVIINPLLNANIKNLALCLVNVGR